MRGLVGAASLIAAAWLSGTAGVAAAPQPIAAVALPAAPTASEATAGGLQQLEEIDIVGERPGPRLWKVSKGDHVLWLLGTLNHLPKRMKWSSSEVEAALADSQQLLQSGPSVSANVGPISAIRLYVQWRRTQKNPGRAKLADWLTAPQYARFEALKSRFDARDSGIEELRPMFAALRLYEQAIDAAGLTQHDEVEQAVIRLAKRRHVPIVRAQLRVDDPSGVLREVGELSPSVEVSCLDATMTRIESDLPAMQERARAWAVGDVDRLRALPYPNQREVCMNVLSNSSRIKTLVEFAGQAWSAQAQSALEHYRVSFAMRPIYELLSSDGPLARFRAEGYTVQGP